MMNVAPLALFVYNRPSHTRQTLEAISSNLLADQTSLYVFIDGPKKDADTQTIERIDETKDIVRSRSWCKELIVVERDTNLGLATSIIEGVTALVNQFGSVIVLEDDLVTSRYFLSFMNQALQTYQFEESVACISGYIYPVEDKLPDAFFLKGADCWGWATWKRAWDHFEKDGVILAQQINDRKLEIEFDFDNSFPYYQMLIDQIANKNNSWAIRWYASAFLKEHLCLYPGISYVKNIGLDGSGTHSGSGLGFLNAENFDENCVSLHNSLLIREDKAAKAVLAKYFRNKFAKQKTGFIQQIQQIVRKGLSKFNNRW